MITSISWGEYFFYTVLFLFVYYSIISVIYFKWELLALAGIKRVVHADQPLSTAALKEQFITKDENDHHVILAIESELHALFNNSSEMISATDLLQSVHKIIQKYPQQTVNAHRNDLTHFIVTESNLIFPGLLGKTEVEQLWFG